MANYQTVKYPRVPSYGNLLIQITGLICDKRDKIDSASIILRDYHQLFYKQFSIRIHF